MFSFFPVIFLLLTMFTIQLPAVVRGLPTPAGPLNSYNNSSDAHSPLQSRIGRTFKNLCTDTRKICNCVTTDTGMNSHEYAVLDMGGQPATWEQLMDECILEGYVNGDGLTYR